MKILKKNIFYKVNTKEESLKIEDFLKGYNGFKEVAYNSEWCYLGTIGENQAWWHAEHYTRGNVLVDSFSEWCELCIEGFAGKIPWEEEEKEKLEEEQKEPITHNSNIIVTEDNAYVGMKVVRGRDWTYGDQDKNSKYGTITSVGHIKGRCRVEWENGHKNSYSIGQFNSYDLYVYKDLSNPPVKQGIVDSQGIPYEFTGEGRKYTFQDGYQGPHPFKIGQRVIVHEGGNLGEKDVEIIIDKKEYPNNNLYPFIGGETKRGQVVACYPHHSRNTRLIVTILDESLGNTLVKNSALMAVETIANNDEQSEGLEHVYKNTGLMPIDDSPSLAKSKPKPKLNLSIEETNIEEIRVNFKPKSRKTRKISLI